MSDQISNGVKTILQVLEPNLISPGGHISWRHVSVYGEELIPAPLDQEGGLDCVLYSSYALFLFQKNLISVTESEAKYYRPSMEEMRLAFIRNRYNIKSFLDDLSGRPLIDEEEANRMTVDEGEGESQVRISRFRVSYSYIDPKSVGSLDISKRAALYGGVILNIPTYVRDSQQNIVYEGNTKVRTRLQDGPHIHTINHAVFSYGTKQHTHGTTVFVFMDSYGRNSSGTDGGHDFVEWSEVLDVYVPRLSFNAYGY